jgi:hypothetical protein
MSRLKPGPTPGATAKAEARTTAEATATAGPSTPTAKAPLSLRMTLLYESGGFVVWAGFERLDGLCL